MASAYSGQRLLGHLRFPGTAKARVAFRGSLPLEPYQLISQYTPEPLLKSVLDTPESHSIRRQVAQVASKTHRIGYEMTGTERGREKPRPSER